jgi:hypothetical protein
MSGRVGLDIRAPIGGLFATLGAMLAIYGAVADDVRRGGLNIDLWWGILMLVFGVLLLLAVRRSTRTVAE